MAKRGRPRKSGVTKDENGVIRDSEGLVLDLRVWAIRDVDSWTRTSVKIYALMNGLTSAQALAELVRAGLEAKGGLQLRSGSFVDEDGSLVAISTDDPRPPDSSKGKSEHAPEE